MKKVVNTFLHEGGWLRALPFVMLFVYLLVIFQTVHILWDDYSFASLSLFSDSYPNVHGTEWTVSQLLKYCAYIYTNWMGRVLFHIFVNDLLLRQLWLYRILAAASITSVFYMLYRFSGVPHKTVYAFLTCLGYGLFSRRHLTDTFYYYSGVAGYIMPLLFMFSGIFLFRKVRADGWNLKNGLSLFLVSFIASMAQEQECFTYCFTLGLLCLYDLIKRRKLHLWQWTLLLVCFTGAALLFLAPGNFSRMGLQGEHRQPTYLLQIYKNVAMFCVTLYQRDNLPFLVTFLGTIIYLAYSDIFVRNRQHNAAKKEGAAILFTVLCVWTAAVLVQSISCSADATVFLWDPVITYPWEISSVSPLYVVNMCLYSALAGVLIYRRLKQWNNHVLSAFVLAAVLTNLSSFFYSYYVVARMTLTLVLALLVVMLRVFSDVKSNCRALAGSAVAAVSCVWLTVFLCGYYANDPIYRSNESIFVSTAARLRAGEPVVLEGLRCDWNRYFTPERVFAHGGNRDILEYYDFPDDVQFIPYPPQLYIEE